MALSRHNIAWRVAGLLIGAVFVYAGVIKALDPIRFAMDIDNFKILPWPIGVRLAFYLPWLEMMCGLALIFGPLRRGALAILTSLMSIFIVGAVAAKARGIDVNCGCFGAASEHLSFAWHLILDFAILAALVALWFAQRSMGSPDLVAHVVNLGLGTKGR